MTPKGRNGELNNYIMNESIKTLLRDYTRDRWPELNCVNVSALRHKSNGKVEWQVAINGSDYIKREADSVDLMSYIYECLIGLMNNSILREEALD